MLLLTTSLWPFTNHTSQITLHASRFTLRRPNHPVHSRSPDGKTALMFAVQAGCDNAVDVLMKHRGGVPDLTATTYGGDTVLHIAARFDHESILFTLFEASVKASPSLLSNLCKQGRFVGRRHVNVLDDMKVLLQEIETGLQRRLLHDIRADTKDGQMVFSTRNASSVIPDGPSQQQTNPP